MSIDIMSSPATADALPESRPACRTASTHPQNVSEWERIVSAVAGGGLLAAGATRRSLGGLGLMFVGGSLIYRGVSGHCMLYEALGLNTAGYENGAVGVRAQHGLRYEKSIIVQRTPEELYAHWRNLENLPNIMRHLVSVTQLDNQRSHWVAQGPMGKQVEWDAEIINERAGELIAWRSVPGSEVDCAGAVHFEALPEGRGTMLHVNLKYEPPGGKTIAAMADMLGVGLDQRMDEDLLRFKQIQEAGEVPCVEGQPRGTCHGV